MEAEKRDTASDSPARTVLLKQSRLIDEQGRLIAAQLHDLRLDAVRKRARIAFELALAAFTAAVVVALAALAWNASHARGLLISAFSTPPDFAQRGFTGQALATQMLDRLRVIDADVPGLRAPSTYADNWSRDIALEIPQTGVSVGELDRTLRRWLGHQIPVTGELVRDGRGVTLTVRAGEVAGVSFSGGEADLPALTDRAAEAIQRQMQPYRYSTWLARSGRRDEADAVAREIVRDGPPSERPYGFLSLGNRRLRAENDARAALPLYREALRLDPRNANFAMVLAHAEGVVGQDEAALAHTRAAIRMIGHGGGGIAREYQPSQLALLGASEAVLTGEIARGSALLEPFRGGRIGGALVPEETLRAALLVRRHQPFAAIGLARRHIDDAVEQWRIGRRAPGDDYPGIVETQGLALAEMDDWAGILTVTDPATPIAVERGPLFSASVPTLPMFSRPKGEFGDYAVRLRPLHAYALARLGRFREAEAEIATTPLDCYRCVLRRAQIAELRGDRRTADHWFGQAVRMAPSIPFADTAWAEALLARGDTAGAIARSQRAHAISPRFAGPLELWGAALIRQGRYGPANARFAKAARYAPQWGALQLHWGDALAGMGKVDQARTKWRSAARMDLSPADRARARALLAGGPG